MISVNNLSKFLKILMKMLEFCVKIAHKINIICIFFSIFIYKYKKVIIFQYI